MAHAHTVLHWQENLKSDEVPPAWMWPLDDELKVWFDEVLEKRANPAAADNDEHPPLEQNELTRGLVRR